MGALELLCRMPEKSRSWVSSVARAGYGAKAVVYVLVGWLAAKAAFGAGGRTTDAQGALLELDDSPLQMTLLALVALGLACYGIWRWLSAFLDAENEGKDAKGLATRAGYFASGAVHFGLCVAAARLLLGDGGGEGEGEAAGWTARLMAQPFGRWLVGAAGAAVGVGGIGQWITAFKGSYRRKFELDGIATRKRGWIDRIAKAGLGARGVVFLMIGFFLVQAALQADPDEAKGMAGAFREMATQPYGPWLLGLTAIGFVCYGIYCGVLAIYGHFSAPEVE